MTQKYILRETPKVKIKENVLVRTNYDRPGAGNWIEGKVARVVSDGFVIADCATNNGETYGEWCVYFNSQCWIEIYDEVKPKVTVTFDSVIMPDKDKNDILAAISQIGHTDKIFNKWGFGKVFEKGTAVAMLFYGPPGTGKTLMAQAIADKIGHQLLIVGPAEIETSTPGGAERNIKRHFAVAAGKKRPQTGETDDEGNPIEGEMAKHVLLFDECDSLITNRSSVGIIMRGQINTLLSELERFDGIVIFTTNAVESLDAAMERRITTKIEFKKPDFEMRKKIWARMIPPEAPLDEDVSLDTLANPGFSGGNIKNIVLNAARHAAFIGAETITMQCFLEAMQRERDGLTAFAPTKVSRVIRSYDRAVEMAPDTEGGVGLEVDRDIVKKEAEYGEGTERPKRKTRSRQAV